MRCILSNQLQVWTARGRGRGVERIAGRLDVRGIVTEGSAPVNNVLVKLKFESSKKSADNRKQKTENRKQGRKVTKCLTKRSAKERATTKVTICVEK